MKTAVGRRVFGCGALAAIAVLVAPSEARANGRFPAAGQIVVHPNDPATVVVRATYGILVSRTGADPFGLVCEQAVGYGDNQDPAVAVTADGTMLAGVVDGLAVSHDGGCTWAFSPEIGPEYVIDVSTLRDEPSRAVAVSYGPGPSGDAVSKVWRSDDDGKTWTRAGVDLPKGLFALTVDVAPKMPERIYVSGRYGPPGYEGALLRSDDFGRTWESFIVPGTTQQALPYIGGMDPNDPDRLYLRLDGDPDDRFVVVTGGGVAFDEPQPTKGSLLAFAVSPDGSTIVMGGEDEGVLRGATTDFSFTKISDVVPRCFTWTPDGLWACADEFRDDFTVGLSIDGGETFEPRMHLQSLCDLVECAADTSVASQCPAQLAKVQLTLKIDSCQEPVAAPPPAPPDDGCSCRTASGRASRKDEAPRGFGLRVAVGLAAALAAFRRRRSSARS